MTTRKIYAVWSVQFVLAQILDMTLIYIQLTVFALPAVITRTCIIGTNRRALSVRTTRIGCAWI